MPNNKQQHETVVTQFTIALTLTKYVNAATKRPQHFFETNVLNFPSCSWRHWIHVSWFVAIGVILIPSILIKLAVIAATVSVFGLLPLLLLKVQQGSHAKGNLFKMHFVHVLLSTLVM